MTKDEEIIALAKECGMTFCEDRFKSDQYAIITMKVELLAFAKAIQEKQREEADMIRAKSPESDIDQATRTT